MGSPRDVWSGARLRQGLVAGLVAMGMAVVVAVPAWGVTGTPVSTVPANPAAVADLSLNLALSPPSVPSGYGPFTITATIVNHGPDVATAVSYANPMYSLPLRYGTERMVPSVGTCRNDDSIAVVCALGTLAVGAQATVAISGTLVGNELDFGFAPTADSASVSATSTDPVASNDMASLRVTSSPVVATTVAYVVGYFTSVLGRVPTAAEMVTWGHLYETTDLEGFALRLVTTNSYRAIWVQQQFLRYLHRGAGAALGFYVGWLAAGRTEDQVLASILSSSEFRHRTVVCGTAVSGTSAGSNPGGCPADEWIVQASFALTGSGVMPASTLAGYDAMVRAGASPYSVAMALVTSAPARVGFVDRLVRSRYGRPPTGFERFVWVLGLLHGTSAVRTTALVLGSVLFTNRVAIPYVTNVPPAPIPAPVP